MNVKENKPLRQALASFEDVERNYVDALRSKGLKFEERNVSRELTNNLLEQLRDRGAIFRNAGASVLYGWLSKACVECTGMGGSQTFSTTLKCHRDCYFCFNHNLAEYDKFFECGCPWKEELENAYKTTGGKLAAMGVSGGEPLLVLDDSIELIKEAQKKFPGVHTRMYTSGDLLTPKSAQQLADAGLKEIRFSVKHDDSPEMRERVLENMAMATDYIEDVMVEMPIEPGTKEVMQEWMQRFQEAGIKGMNLLEFCFPFHSWEEFERRGFLLKNPPYPIMYDYSYSGGLAIAGSEVLALELMLWAIDSGLTFGLHYCSLENKHRSEMLQVNLGGEKAHPIFDFDMGDYFIKTAKVFGPDRAVAEPILRAASCEHIIPDEEEDSTSFPRAYLPLLEGSGIRPMVSVSLMEKDAKGYYLREVALQQP